MDSPEEGAAEPAENNIQNGHESQGAAVQNPPSAAKPRDVVLNWCGLEESDETDDDEKQDTTCDTLMDGNVTNSDAKGPAMSSVKIENGHLEKDLHGDDVKEEIVTPQKKKRGRPPKAKVEAQSSSQATVATESSIITQSTSSSKEKKNELSKMKVSKVKPSEGPLRSEDETDCEEIPKKRKEEENINGTANCHLPSRDREQSSSERKRDEIKKEKKRNYSRSKIAESDESTDSSNDDEGHLQITRKKCHMKEQHHSNTKISKSCESTDSSPDEERNCMPSTSKPRESVNEVAKRKKKRLTKKKKYEHDDEYIAPAYMKVTRNNAGSEEEQEQVNGGDNKFPQDEQASEDEQGICRFCNASFKSKKERDIHFKSDFDHRNTYEIGVGKCTECPLGKTFRSLLHFAEHVAQVHEAIYSKLQKEMEESDQCEFKATNFQCCLEKFYDQPTTRKQKQESYWFPIEKSVKKTSAAQKENVNANASRIVSGTSESTEKRVCEDNRELERKKKSKEMAHSEDDICQDPPTSQVEQERERKKKQRDVVEKADSDEDIWQDPSTSQMNSRDERPKKRDSGDYRKEKKKRMQMEKKKEERKKRKCTTTSESSDDDMGSKSTHKRAFYRDREVEVKKRPRENVRTHFEDPIREDYFPTSQMNSQEERLKTKDSGAHGKEKEKRMRMEKKKEERKRRKYTTTSESSEDEIRSKSTHERLSRDHREVKRKKKSRRVVEMADSDGFHGKEKTRMRMETKEEERKIRRCTIKDSRPLAEVVKEERKKEKRIQRAFVDVSDEEDEDYRNAKERARIEAKRLEKEKEREDMKTRRREESVRRIEQFIKYLLPGDFTEQERNRCDISELPKEQKKIAEEKNGPQSGCLICFEGRFKSNLHHKNERVCMDHMRTAHKKEWTESIPREIDTALELRFMGRNRVILVPKDLDSLTSEELARLQNLLTEIPSSSVDARQVRLQLDPQDVPIAPIAEMPDEAEPPIADNAMEADPIPAAVEVPEDPTASEEEEEIRPIQQAIVATPPTSPIYQTPAEVPEDATVSKERLEEVKVGEDSNSVQRSSAAAQAIIPAATPTSPIHKAPAIVPPKGPRKEVKIEEETDSIQPAPTSTKQATTPPALPMKKALAEVPPKEPHGEVKEDEETGPIQKAIVGTPTSTIKKAPAKVPPKEPRKEVKIEEETDSIHPSPTSTKQAAQAATPPTLPINKASAEVATLSKERRGEINEEEETHSIQQAIVAVPRTSVIKMAPARVPLEEHRKEVKVEEETDSIQPSPASTKQAATPPALPIQKAVVSSGLLPSDKGELPAKRSEQVPLHNPVKKEELSDDEQEYAPYSPTSTQMNRAGGFMLDDDDEDAQPNAAGTSKSQITPQNQGKEEPSDYED